MRGQGLTSPNISNTRPHLNNNKVFRSFEYHHLGIETTNTTYENNNHFGTTIFINPALVFSPIMGHGRFLIKLRITARSFEPIHALRAKYNTSYTPWHGYGSIGMMSNFLRDPKYNNREILEATLSKMASQRSPFNLNLHYAFRSVKKVYKAVSIDASLAIYSELYRTLENNLKDTLGLEHISGGYRAPHAKAFLPVVPLDARRYEKPNPAPRILICRVSDPELADEIVEDLQKAHPGGFGIITADAFLLIQTDGERKEVSSKTYTFTGGSRGA